MFTKPKGHRLRIGRVSEPGRIYLVTTIIENRIPIFHDIYLGRLLVQVLKSSQPFADSLAYVVMPDHLHWLLQLGEKYDLSTIVANVKSGSARMINQRRKHTGQFWQTGFHDHALRDEEDIKQVARYVLANPLRANLVENIADYPLWDAKWM